MLDWISGLTSALRNAGEVIYGEYLAWLYRTVFGAIAEFFTQMSGMGTELFDLSWVKAALEFFRLFGWGLYTVGIAVAVFDFAIEYQCCGRANIKTTLLNILKGFFAASLFTRLPVELYRFTVTLQNTFTRDLIGTASGNVLELAREVLYRYSPNGVNALNGFGLLELLFLIALGYCVIKVFFSNIKRGGNPADANRGREPVPVLPAARLRGRLHAMVQTGGRTLPDHLHADHLAVPRPYDMEKQCPARLRCDARRKRSAPHRAGVRTGYRRQGQHDLGYAHDHNGGESDENFI